MKKSIISVLVLIVVLTLFSGCKGNENNLPIKETTNEATKPVIAVSIVPEGTFVKEVCGDLVEVVTLIPPGFSPENYEPTPKEMEKFSKASIYFTIGVQSEVSILPKAGDLKIVHLEDEVSKVYKDITFESGERDPHIWLSPKRVKVMVDTIAKEMAELDEKNKDTYFANADAYKEKLDFLDKEITDILKDVQNRKFIVFHPAFGYLADDYNLTMYSLEEEGKEATVRHLQEMIDLAKRENIKAIFYQEEMDSSQSKAFAEEIGGKTIQLSPLAPNYVENLKNMVNLIAEVMK